MANTHNPFASIKRSCATELEDTFNNVSGQEEIIKLIDFDKLIPSDNPYPLTELDDLITSIKQYGIEQSLVVKKQGENYAIISGHRRYFAVKEILGENNDDYEELEQLYCKVISDKEDELITRLRLHESNLQSRPLLKMPHEVKLAIIDDYINLLQQARENNVLIHGKPVKGKTKDLIAEAFNISTATASRLISEINNPIKGGVSNDTPTENVGVDKTTKDLQTILNKLQNVNVERAIRKSGNHNELKKLVYQVYGEIENIVGFIEKYQDEANASYDELNILESED